MQQKLGREPVNEAKVVHRLCVCVIVCGLAWYGQVAR